MRSITVKLVAAFLAVSLVGTVLMAGVMGRMTTSEFGSYVVSQEQAQVAHLLADYYTQQGSWQGVEALLAGVAPGNQFGRGAGRGLGQGAGGQGRGQGHNRMALADSSGTIVVAGAGFQAGEQVDVRTLQRGSPVMVDDTVVGVVIQRRGAPVVTAAGNAFLARMNSALALTAIGATLAALLLGALLSSTLTRPIRELTAASYAVAQGELGRTVAVHSRDELGTLAAAFNQMSTDLAQVQARRQQLTADIAHELRTPISIIQGHAEALRDGVLPASDETFTLIHDEALRLKRMVEELRTLSSAESGELPLLKRPLHVASWLQALAEAQQPAAARRGVRIEARVLDDGAISVDPDRLAQVVNNLIDNAVRHSAEGSSVVVGAQRREGSLALFVQDSGPGIATQDLPHLFERFYRGDKSRRRHEGGSGLGLAIAHAIVVMHGGTIRAAHAPDGGALFTVTLPLVADAEAADG